VGLSIPILLLLASLVVNVFANTVRSFTKIERDVTGCGIS